MTTASDDLNEILNEAIPRWAKLTGTKLGTNSYTMTIGSRSEFQDYDKKTYIDDLNDARKLDVSGTTAILLLRGLFETYAKERSFDAHTILYATEKVEKTLADLRAFRDLITRPACEEAATTFRETLRAAAVHYGYDFGRLKKHLADDRTLGDLRLAAARSCERLAVHQFAQGKPDPTPLQYNREIFEFSNINSFVAALRGQWISGITLALIRDASDDRGVYKAYFVLGLRNGDNVTILTDHEEGVHPEYHDMTRRPERQLEKRAQCHWFPYRLLDEDPVQRAKKKVAIVAIDAKAVPVDEIAKLEPSEFVWLTLLFGLVAEKYGGDFRTDDLSYTGEMVVAPHALVEAASALVRTGDYQPLVLPKLTVETTTQELADTHEPVGHNAWLEDRYRHHVPEIVLDVVGERRALDVEKQLKKLLPGKVKTESLPQIRREPNVIGWGPDHRTTPIHPRALDPTYFGTKKQIERNRAWSARVNMMQVIQRLATEEFVQKSDLVMRWYRARVDRNLPFLLEAVARGELIAPTMRWKSGIEHGFPLHDTQVWGSGNIIKQKIAKNWWHAFPGDSFSDKGVTLGAWDSRDRHVTCFRDPPTHATVFTIISPDNPRAIALVAGIPEKRLPWPLQHWWTYKPYTGNSILSRVDPQDWRLDNPWRHLELRITVALCKREYNKLRRQHGLAAVAEAKPTKPTKEKRRRA